MSEPHAPRFLTEAQVPRDPDDLVVREAWAGRLSLGVLLIAVAVGYAVAVVGYLDGTFPLRLDGHGSSLPGLLSVIGGLAFGFVALLSLFAGLLFLAAGRAALRAGNWALRARPEGLYLNLRAYTDHRLPATDAIVAFLPKPAIRWLRGYDERVRRVPKDHHAGRVDDSERRRQSYLEIALDPDELSRIENRLAEERRRAVPTLVPGVTSRAKGACLGRRPGEVLRLDWNTAATRLRPDLGLALSRLRGSYRLAEDVASAQPPVRTLDAADREARLAEMVGQGDIIGAVKLAQDLYGYSLTEAKRFVDELAGR
jgi:hypothetical protein